MRQVDDVEDVVGVVGDAVRDVVADAVVGAVAGLPGGFSAARRAKAAVGVPPQVVTKRIRSAAQLQRLTASHDAHTAARNSPSSPSSSPLTPPTSNPGR